MLHEEQQWWIAEIADTVGTRAYYHLVITIRNACQLYPRHLSFDSWLWKFIGSLGFGLLTTRGFCNRHFGVRPLWYTVVVCFYACNKTIGAFVNTLGLPARKSGVSVLELR